MTPVIVNVDFEEMLSHGHPRPALRANVEFFALWLCPEPLLAHREYSQEYLEHIEKHIGMRPSYLTKGKGVWWWGDLTNQKLMRQLSDKTEFLKWWQTRWPLEAHVCFSFNEIEKLVDENEWLIKKSDGMSGRGHVKVNARNLALSRKVLDKSLPHGVVVEPLYHRTFDVSALWLADEKRFIFYQNKIDARFQWRECLLSADKMAKSPEGTRDWSTRLHELRDHVSQLGYEGPFSVDAFFYESQAGVKFHPGSEMNPRKTMGWLAYQFWKIRKPKFLSLSLHPGKLSEGEWREAKTLSSCLLLSPPENPFVWLLTEASTVEGLTTKKAAAVAAIFSKHSHDTV